MALALTIDSVDQVSKLVRDSLTVDQTSDGLNSTCSFDLFDKDVFEKDAWTVGVTRVEDGDVITGYVAWSQDTKVEVSVTDGATTYFAGILSRVGITHLGKEGLTFHCDCHDFNQMVEESVVDSLEEYGAATDEEIIDDIFTEYVTGIDFATHVTGPFVSDEISFDGVTVRNVLDTLAAKSGYVWYIDYSKKLHYKVAGEDAPAWHLSDDPDNVNSFSYFDDITKELDATNLVNQVLIVGGSVSLWFQDATSMAEYGTHKAIVRDTNLVDIDDMEDRGDAVLAKYKDPVVTYRLRTYQDGLRAGMYIRIVCALYDVDDTFLVNQLTITFPIDGDPEYEIVCSGLKSPSSGGAAAQRLALDYKQAVPAIAPGQLPIASRGWVHDLVFSATDNDTVAWTAGTITTASSQTFSIDAGNTDDPAAMAATSYVYLDTAISDTELQITTDPAATVGTFGRILIAVASPQAAGLEATFVVFGGEGIGVLVDTANIADDAITAVKAGLTLLGWSHDLVFSATDHDTVAWASGSIEVADGVTYSIDAGNTGNIAAVTYIYLDTDTSITVLQTTTTAATATGNNKLLVAVAQNVAAGKNAIYQTFGGEGTGVLVDTANIAVGAVDTTEIAALAVEAAKIGALAVETGKLALLAVENAQLGNSAVTADKILANTITAAEILGNTITAAEIAGNTITATEILGNTITAAEVAANTITAAEIAANTITATEIAATTITAGQIAASTITTAQIAATTIVAGNIAGNTITAAEIAVGTITTTEIAATTILAANIAGGTITATQIAAATITTAQIAATTILAGNIAANTITANQILGNTITATEIAAATITATELNVATLSAIAADMGTLTAGTITGGTIRTAASPAARVELNTSYLAGYSDAATKQFYLDASTGKAYAGAGNVWLDTEGLSLTQGVANPNYVKWMSGSDNVADIAGFSDASYHSAHIRAVRTAGYGGQGRIFLEAQAPASYYDTEITILSGKSGTKGSVGITLENAIRVSLIDTGLRLRDGLYVGNAAGTPTANDIICTGTLKTNGGYEWNFGGAASGTVVDDYKVHVQIAGNWYTLRARAGLH